MIRDHFSAVASEPPCDALPLKAEQLAWGYDQEAALGRTSQLEVEAGEALAILGPNGAGKTTLLRTFAGQLAPLAGVLQLSGAVPLQLPPHERARRVAILPQGLPVDLDLTVSELVEIGRTAHLRSWGRLARADVEAIDRALVACDLTGHHQRQLGQLSGGERQRALIAMTLAQGAPLLLLDEPTSHLDLRRRYALFELLARLRCEEKLAMVLVLHDLADAYTECDQVRVLFDGRAEEISLEREDWRKRLAEAFGVPEDRIPAVASGRK